MGEDVPLTAFDSGDDDSSNDADSDGESSERDESAAEPGEIEPAESEPAETPSLTYTSSPDGAPCAACGETVEKRWHAGEGGVSADGDGAGVDDPDALVCPDCKEW